MSKPLAAYFRVSTREQGRSGLGIDAQRAGRRPRATVNAIRMARADTFADTVWPIGRRSSSPISARTWSRSCCTCTPHWPRKSAR